MTARAGIKFLVVYSWKEPLWKQGSQPKLSAYELRFANLNSIGALPLALIEIDLSSMALIFN